MPVQQIPLVYGDGRNRKTMDYTQNFPVNMVPVPREIKQANGYMRSWYGLSKVMDVDGRSRGVIFNAYDNTVYRVQGGKLYRGTGVLGNVTGTARCSMAYSRESVAVAQNGAMTLYRYDGSTAQITNWPASSANPTGYNWGQIQDVVRLRGRYIWSEKGSDRFWITDIENETHPDRESAFYRAESMPDGLLALRSWRDYVLCFGSSTIEFFTLTGDSSQVYASQPSYMLNEGIAGQWAVTSYADSFAYLTGLASGVVTVRIMEPTGGSSIDIGNKQVKDMLAGYSTDELAGVVLEAFATSDGEFLLMHLPDYTLVYDKDASQALGIQCWSKLQSDVLNERPYRAIDFCNEGSRVTCGDTLDNIRGAIDLTTSGQYGEDVEMLLFTPMMNYAGAILTDLELDASLGSDNPIKHIFVTASEDGILWATERLMRYDRYMQLNGRAHMLKVGRVRSNVTFRFRIVGQTPVYLSKCRINVT